MNTNTICTDPQVSDPRQLVLTEADQAPPPDATVPEPGSEKNQPAALGEVSRLAERVGGLEKLRDLVDELIRSRGFER